MGGVNVCWYELSCILCVHTLQVPSPLTAEMEAARKDKLAERNRVKKKQKREREKQAKDVRDLEKISEAQQKVEDNLSEREKVHFRMATCRVTPGFIQCSCLFWDMSVVGDVGTRGGCQSRCCTFLYLVDIPRYIWVLLSTFGSRYRMGVL